MKKSCRKLMHSVLDQLIDNLEHKLQEPYILDLRVTSTRAMATDGENAVRDEDTISEEYVNAEILQLDTGTWEVEEITYKTWNTPKPREIYRNPRGLTATLVKALKE